MIIVENIDLKELYNCWLHSKPFKAYDTDFSVLKVNGAIKEYRLRKNGKEEVVLKYPKTNLGFCIITDLID